MCTHIRIQSHVHSYMRKEHTNRHVHRIAFTICCNVDGIKDAYGVEGRWRGVPISLCISSTLAIMKYSSHPPHISSTDAQPCDASSLLFCLHFVLVSFFFFLFFPQHHCNHFVSHHHHRNRLFLHLLTYLLTLFRLWTRVKLLTLIWILFRFRNIQSLNETVEHSISFVCSSINFVHLQRYTELVEVYFSVLHYYFSTITQGRYADCRWLHYNKKYHRLFQSAISIKKFFFFFNDSDKELPTSHCSCHYCLFFVIYRIKRFRYCWLFFFSANWHYKAVSYMQYVNCNTSQLITLAKIYAANSNYGSCNWKRYWKGKKKKRRGKDLAYSIKTFYHIFHLRQENISDRTFSKLSIQFS